MLKRIAHTLLGCRGLIDREVDDRGIEWIGLRCNTCGRLKSRTLSGVQTTEEGQRLLQKQAFIVDEYGNTGWKIP